METDYPDVICKQCGDTHGRRSLGVATWYAGTCNICGQYKLVTEPRDFGHLNNSWREALANDDDDDVIDDSD
jgi:hypothetical protein